MPQIFLNDGDKKDLDSELNAMDPLLEAVACIPWIDDDDEKDAMVRVTLMDHLETTGKCSFAPCTADGREREPRQRCSSCCPPSQGGRFGTAWSVSGAGSETRFRSWRAWTSTALP